MATFARRVRDGRWCIAVRGELRAADLRRLERTCAPALERCPLPLDIAVDALESLDEPARRFFICLLRRGAALVGHNREHWAAAIGLPAPR